MSCKGECVGGLGVGQHLGPHATGCVDRAPNAQEWEQAERIVLTLRLVQFPTMTAEEHRARVQDMAWMLMDEAHAEARR